MTVMDRKKITLVLLPGLNGTAGLFDPLLAIATDKYELMVISYPTREVKSYTELTDYVLKKISAIEGRFVVVGESFSGPIAVFLAANNIHGLSGIILVATFIRPPYFSFFNYLPWTLMFALAKPLYWVSIKLSSSNKASLVKAASIELQKIKPRVLAGRVKAALTVDAGCALEKVRIPVAYFRADYDVVVPAWNVKKVLAVKPDINVVRFNSQHFLLQSVPQDAWNAIDKFIQEIN